jgi:hypothetical protein
MTKKLIPQKLSFSTGKQIRRLYVSWRFIAIFTRPSVSTFNFNFNFNFLPTLRRVITVGQFNSWILLFVID